MNEISKIWSCINRFMIDRTVENATDLLNQIQMYDRNSMQNLHNYGLACLITQVCEYNGKYEKENKI